MNKQIQKELTYWASTHTVGEQKGIYMDNSQNQLKCCFGIYILQLIEFFKAALRFSKNIFIL